MRPLTKKKANAVAFCQTSPRLAPIANESFDLRTLLASCVLSLARQVIPRQRYAQKVCVSTLLGTCVMMSTGCQFQAARHTADGKWHVQNNQFGPAIDSYQQALMADPRSADANYNLGTTYYYLAKQTGQAHFNPKSEDLLRQAISLNPNHVDAYRTLSALYIETQRPNDAFNLMRSWQVAQPTSPEPLVELARLYREHNDSTRAVQHLADALTIDPNNSRALVAMGSLREEQGQLELALKNYTRSYQANNYQPELATKIASLQQRMNSSINPSDNTRYATPSMNNSLR